MRLRYQTALAALAVAAAGSVTTGPAFAATTPYVLTPASTAVTAALASGTTFQVKDGTLTVTCTTASFSGKTPKAGLTIGTPASRDHISGCTDSSGGSETVTMSGTWKLVFAGPARARLVIPKDGATVTTTLGRCVNTFPPNTTSRLLGSYSGKTGTFTVTGAAVPDKSSCASKGKTLDFTFSLVLTPTVKVVHAA